MNKQVINRCFQLMRAGILLLMLQLLTSTAYAVEAANGNGCIAANLAQAMELSWDHARVSNPASNPSDRFVTCTLGAGQKLQGNPGTITATTVESGGVTAVFLDGAAADSEVSCIFREVGNRESGLAALDMATVVIDAPDTIPGTLSATFSDTDNLDIGSFFSLFPPPNFSNIRSLTVTCRLDPGTGITAYWANQTPAPAPDP